MAGEIPQYFLLRSDTHYIAAEALVAVKRDALPSVDLAVSAEFEKAPTIRAVALPNPGDPCGDDDERNQTWFLMAGMKRDAGMKPNG